MEYSTPGNDSSVGCGLLGCAGGLLLGFFGGGLLLVGLSLLLALQATPIGASAAAGPDLRLTVREEFLNRAIQAAGGQETRVDILPGNQVRLEANTSVAVLGLTLPVQVKTLFSLQATPQAIQANLIDMQVQGVELTPELQALLGANTASINQELDGMIAEMADVLGAPLILTGLSTGETELWLEASEQR